MPLFSRAAAAYLRATGALSTRLLPPVSYRRPPLEGDPALVTFLTGRRTRHYRRLVVMCTGPAGTRVALKNATPDTPFEVGSLTKVCTVELHRQAVSDGTVHPGTTLGDLLPVAGAPVAGVTLEELAGHVSGLGTWGDDGRDGPLTVREHRTGATPHEDTPLEELLDRARRDKLRGRGGYAYSNIGIALLGHALAAAEDTDYATLLHTRLTGPLGMTHTAIQRAGAPLTAGGVRRRGQAAAPWPLGAYAPAGGAVSTARDLTALARHLLATLDPADLPAEGVHRGLPVDTEHPHARLLKIGATGGFTATLGLDLTTGTAAVLLTDTALRLDPLTREVLEQC